ncbi:MAG: PEP-CTERM-box response regulator transcription factor [Verrucomicrobia bacterium]|nr:MAG: PEP-CTERM-box response regulator transcription factor [Verrucomicrobiota bacterium]
MKPKLLIVDDDEVIRLQMKWALGQDYDVVLAEDRPSAVAACRDHRPPVVLLDLGMPPEAGLPDEGMAALSEMLALDGLVKVIIITGQGEKRNALQAIDAGAFYFLVKPIEVEDLKVILGVACQVGALQKENRQMQQHFQTDTFEGMLGTSRQMQDVFASIRKVATTAAPVLLLGESGTGKEMAALAIHRRSDRKEGPFVAINCSAIPETLLESELFGHEKGSFTGAHMQRKGRIEMAFGGTLFLDEIGELPLPIQVKLLRFLQGQRIERVGGRQEIQVDTRVVAATNADLEKGIVEGRFREDLFYRLAVVVIKLAALRDREDDVQLLAKDFLRRCARETGKDGLDFDREAKQALSRHTWPGNVRELENRVRRAVIMAEGRRLTAHDLELAHLNDSPGVGLKEAREAAERDTISRALRRHSGKIAPAAVELGVSRPTLYELMEKLGIKRE